MARTDRLPTAFDRIGLKYAFRARVLELPFQTIDIRRIDRTMAKHNICIGGTALVHEPSTFSTNGLRAEINKEEYDEGLLRIGTGDGELVSRRKGRKAGSANGCGV
jgi:hypothetical protein